MRRPPEPLADRDREEAVRRALAVAELLRAAPAAVERARTEARRLLNILERPR